MGDTINTNKLHSPAADQVSSRRTFLHIRNAIVYILIYTAVSALVSYLFIVPIVPGNTNLKLIFIPAFSYLFLGFLFTWVLYTKLNLLIKLNLNSGLQYAVAVFVCIFSVTLLTGVIKRNESVLTSLFYSCIFQLPYLIHQTWIFYKSLSVAGYSKVWYPPEHADKAPAAIVSLNSIPIKIRVSPLYGAADKIYETTIPVKLSIGTAFTNLIYRDENMYSDTIECRDVNSRLYGWQFFTSDFWGMLTQPVDADLSLHENSIKDNSIIIARRIQKP